MQTLGFEIIESDSTRLTVRDQNQAISFDFVVNQITVNGVQRPQRAPSMKGPSSATLTTVTAVQDALGTDMVWDESAMTIQLSSAATLFTPHH